MQLRDSRSRSRTDVELDAARNASFIRCAAHRHSPTLREGVTDAPSPRSGVSRLLIPDDRSRTRRAVLSTQPEIELIREAADGGEAIAAVKRLRPDIVILDLRTPRLDGIAASRHIKSSWSEIRIIAHRPVEELRADVLAAGADAFVFKNAGSKAAGSARPRKG